MPSLRLICDMNVSPFTVAALCAAGWDAQRVSAVMPAKSPDDEVLDWARKDGSVVVSQDTDFSALLAIGGHSRPSLVSLRLALVDPPTISRRLLEVLPRVEEDLRSGAIIVIEDACYRVRKLPIS